MFYCRPWLGASRSRRLFLPQEKRAQLSGTAICLVSSFPIWNLILLICLFFLRPTLISCLFAEEQWGLILISGLSLSALTSGSETEDQETRETCAPLFLVGDRFTLLLPPRPLTYFLLLLSFFSHHDPTAAVVTVEKSIWSGLEMGVSSFGKMGKRNRCSVSFFSIFPSWAAHLLIPSWFSKASVFGYEEC